MKINSLLISKCDRNVVYEGVLVREKGYNSIRKTKYVKSHGHGSYSLYIPANVDAIYIRHEFNKASTMEWLYILHFQNGIASIIMNYSTFHDDNTFAEIDCIIRKKTLFEPLKKQFQSSHPINLLDEL